MDDKRFFYYGLLFIGLFLIGIYAATNIRCEASARAQGLVGEFGVAEGCIYTLPDGRKVNEKNYRVL